MFQTKQMTPNSIIYAQEEGQRRAGKSNKLGLEIARSKGAMLVASYFMWIYETYIY